MKRYSPQDIDRAENERLDEAMARGELIPSSGNTRGYVTARGTTQPFEHQLSAEKRTGTPRKVVHKRHGWMPTLEDLERRQT